MVKHSKVIHRHLTQTESTNDAVKSMPKPHKGHALLVTTDFQTAGRGQKGNSWESECGKNLLFSILVCPDDISPSRQFCISEAISLASVNAAKKFSDDKAKPYFSIKWPNDIYWKEKKIAGILIENELNGRHISSCIIGEGMDVNQKVFISNAPNPVSLYNINGHETDRDLIMQEIMDLFMVYMERLSTEGTGTLHNEYMQHLFRREGFHPYRDKEGIFSAKIIQVKSDGHIVLEDSYGKVREYEFKEVAFVLKTEN